MPSLLLLTGPLAGRRFQVTGEATLGRSPSCEIPLQDAKVSRRHARLVVGQEGVQIEDLGSRNGTLVNGERIEAPVRLVPGDKVEVGDTSALFDPPAKASLSDRKVELTASVPVEEVLPRVGREASVYSLAVELLSATSEAMVLRRTAEELARGANADLAAALLAGATGLLTASVVGARSVDVPRGLARKALEGREVCSTGKELCAPLVPAGGAPLGLLYAERAEPFTEPERALAAALGRMAGQGLAAVRLRAGRGSMTEAVLVGTSKPFRRALEEARRAAASAEPVLLVGEAGTGRAAVAALIHALSPRSLGPLVTVECAGEPREVEVELFGQAGTAGAPPRAAALLRADGGTLLLREVQALPKPLAERLAHALTRKAATAPQGGEEPVEVRLAATASQPLAALRGREGFDEALATALVGPELELPPLRARQPDLLPLIEHFATRSAQAHRQKPFSVTPEARRLLSDYAWPGNVLELERLVERLAILYPGLEVSALKLPPEIQQGTPGRSRSLDELLSTLERQAILEALREARGKKIRAAVLLGISRPTLDKKIEDYGLVVEKARGRRRVSEAS